MKIIELLINELDKLTGVDAVALVEEPAIEANFFAFKKDNDDVEDRILLSLIQTALQECFIEKNPGETKEEYVSRCLPVLKAEGYPEDQALAICYDSFAIDVDSLPPYINEIDIEKDEFESFTDYPESATNAAKRALEWRDGHPDQDCGTRVGWARANQLANREPISEETIARMASFARHLQHEDIPYSEGCGGLMVDAWGGRAGIEWAQNKLEDIRQESSAAKFSFAIDEDQQMVVGPLMIPDKLIARRGEDGEPYFVFFSEDTIKEIAQKVMKNKLIDKLNIEHDPDKPVDGYMVSTWLIEDPEKDKQQVYGFDFKKGTWMGQYKIEDPTVWQMVKKGEIKGFSVEGFFSDKFIQAKAIK